MGQSVVVIGGGLIGLLCARLLSERGVSVMLFDRQQLGREASWAGAGILSPIYPARYPSSVVELTRWSRAEYPRLAHDLIEGTGVDSEYLKSGLIILDPEPFGAESQENLEKLEEPFEYLGSARLAQQEPQLVKTTGQALHLPTVAQVRSPRLMDALKKAVSAKAEIREGVAVTGFEIAGSRLRAVRTDAGKIPADHCIVASGAWSGALLATAGLSLSVTPVRGQMLSIAASPGYLNHILVYGYRYLVPRRDGRILVGSTMEHTGFDKSTTAEGRDVLHRAALELLPGLGRYPVEAHWAGLRPGSPDSLPYIGEHSEIKGLFVCTGHYRNGFATAPATARIVVDLLQGQVPPLDPAPFRLDRPIPPSVRPVSRPDL